MASAPVLLPGRSWPNLVMHVLAHVSATAHLPASLYDSVYIGYAEQHLGLSGQRPLGEDAAVLGQVLPTHELLSQVQLLAWLFDDVAQAAACAQDDLARLAPDQVARPQLLGALIPLGAPVELLRCAALLEHEPQVRLPELAVQRPPLSKALTEVVRAAPRLAACGLMSVPALRLRGRVFGDEIWVGTSAAELALEADHVAWQAGHEATVREVSKAAPSPRHERQVEQVAVVLLAERAAEAGLRDGHAKWLSHFGEAAPETDRAGLDDEALALLIACHRRPA